jgi:predicted O-linked N-acetylglucosamine transferase (SPINDLY family)
MEPARLTSAAAGAARALSDGNAHLDRGDFVAAERSYRAAVALAPNLVNARINLGFVLRESGRLVDAEAEFAASVALAPDNGEAQYLYGATLLEQGDAEAAVAPLTRAVAMQPLLAHAHRDLGRALFDAGRVADAEAALRRGTTVVPGQAELHFFLGNVYAESQRFERALECYRAALALQPSMAAAYSNMVPALIHACDFEGAVRAAGSALALDPASISARSNLLMALSRDPDCSLERYLDEARVFGTAVASFGMANAELEPALLAASNLAAAAERRRGERAASAALRVGFVSGDLRRHPVGYFLEQVLAHWDHDRMTLVAFANQRGGDDVTERLKRHFDTWHDVAGLDDAQLLRLVRDTGVDVLVDLSGHTPRHRLPVFARRAAPVQVSWLGYWASTGVPAMDYLLADPVSVPEAHRAGFTEAVWWLPQTRLCFSPPENAPDVAPLPALARGHVTFGSFQSMVKLNRPVLDLWGLVLAAVPRSRLRLQALQFGDEVSLAAMRRRLADSRIDLDRVDLVGPASRAAYLAAYAEIDVILDTFPHTGGTTTCEALWMGVPTLTIAGRSLLARQGASILTAAGLLDWVAADECDFVDRAVRHCADPQTLDRLRLSMREQVVGSPLFDADRFADSLQEALATMYARASHAVRSAMSTDAPDSSMGEGTRCCPEC